MANVLVLGSGAREQAIVEALVRSPHVSRAFWYPGNGLTGTIGAYSGINPLADIKHPLQMLDKAKDTRSELTVVGPELPFTFGIADKFAEAGKLLLGPTAAAAQLEGSKIFAKQFMKRHGIPTAPFEIFDNVDKVVRYVKRRNCPLVIKADGLCGGKGVYVCDDLPQAMAALIELMVDHVHGQAGERIVIEEMLVGTETSFFLLADGKTFVEFGTAGDHKRAFDGDRGPNTGGMGAFSPCPFVTKEIREQILDEIVEPTISGMAAEGHPFKGFLYVGLMLTAHGPKVIEYNVRLGDPEAQVILPCLKSDAFELFQAAATGNLSDMKVEWSDECFVGVVLVSAKYPEKENIRHRITGPIRPGEAGKSVNVYHAATIRYGDDFYATGGRIMTVVGRGSSYSEAQAKAYNVVRKIHFDGMRFRSDIGHRAMAT